MGASEEEHLQDENSVAFVQISLPDIEGEGHIIRKGYLLKNKYFH